MVSPPEVDGRCEGVIELRRGNTGEATAYWFGVKYLGVLFVLVIVNDVCNVVARWEVRE
jgi:hypothetical protein